MANIHSLALSSKHSFLLSASSSYGVASRSDPFRGKVARGFLDAAGLLNGGGIGNPNTEFSPDVSCLAIGSDANKIVWGFRTGSIAITSLGRQGSNPHGLVRNVKFSPRGNHLAEVGAIAFDHSVRGQRRRSQARQVALGAAADCFVTGGADGTVRLWSPDRALPLWIGTTVPEDGDEASQEDEDLPRRRSSALPSSVTKLDFDADRGIIAAGTTSGQVYIWTHINVSSLLSLSGRAWSDSDGIEPEITTVKQDAARRAFREEMSRVRKVVIVPEEEESSQQRRQMESRGQVEYLCLSTVSAVQTRLIVHRKGSSSLEYHSVTETPEGSRITTQLLAMTATPEGRQFGGEGYITCVRVELRAANAESGTQSSFGTPAQSPLLRPTLGEAIKENGDSIGSPQVRPLTLETPPVRNLSSGHYAEKDFVCAGTSSGCLVGWVLPSFEGQESSTAPHFSPRSSPTFILDCHHAAITSLDVAPHLFVVGTIDGQLKAFDSLTGEPLRTWTDRMATKHLARQLLDPSQAQQGTLSTDERERFTVKQILVDEEWLVAAIGPWVLAWRPESALSGHQKRHAPRLASPHSNGTPPVGRRTSGMPPLSKYARMKELKTELAESSLILEREKASRQESYERLRFARGSQEVGGLSEDEALEYAMMLSRQEAEEQAQRQETGEHEQESQLSELARIRKEDKELQDALEQIALAEAEESRADLSSRGASPGSRTSRSSSEADDLSAYEEEDYEGEDGDEEFHSRYLSPSPHASPLLSARSPGSSNSRAWDILRSSRSLSSSGAASPLPVSTSASRSRWGEHTKVQTVRVPRESWSPQVLPAANGRSVHAGGAGDGGQEEDWPNLQSGSYSSSQQGMSPLAQEESFRLDDEVDPMTRFTETETGKGKAKADDGEASLPPSELPPPASPTPQQASLFPGPPGTPLSPPQPQPQTQPAVSTRTVQGAWAKGTPRFKTAAAVGTGHSSSSPWGARGSGGGASPAAGAGGFAYRNAPTTSRPGDDFDEDLRFAIELSLAEERSRV